MKVITIILAGGKSSRMGKNKGLLDINGQPLLTKIYHIAQELTEEVYIVTSYPEEYRSSLPVECNFMIESSPFQGSLIAFAEALNYVKADWILLLACDLPFLNGKEIKSWLNYLPHVKENAIAFLPKNNHIWECLCGFYRYRCQDSLRKSIQQGNKSFQKWLNHELVEELTIENKTIFFNCNSPEDYQIFLKNNSLKSH